MWIIIILFIDTQLVFKVSYQNFNAFLHRYVYQLLHCHYWYSNEQTFKFIYNNVILLTELIDDDRFILSLYYWVAKR